MDDSSAWEVGGSGLGSVVRSCDRFARYNLSPRPRLLFSIKVTDPDNPRFFDTDHIFAKESNYLHFRHIRIFLFFV